MSEFEHLYTTHVAAVFRYALRCVGRRDVAEDLTSEAFLALFRHRDTIDVSQLPGWLLTAVKNRAIDYWRHRAIEQRYAAAATRADLPPVREPRVDDDLFNHPSLGPEHRVCLTLRYVHGMNRAEIAGRTGLSPEQVKNRIQYALRVLREQVAADGSRGTR
jgi:RNA polymerase sigma-70 factor (ECF subfamily)